MSVTPGTITCPHCHQPFELTDAVSSQLQEQLQREMQTQLAQEKQKIWDQALEKASAQSAGTIKTLSVQLEQSQKTELQLRQERQAVEARSRSLELEVQRRVDEKGKLLVEQTRKQEADVFELKLREKEKQIEQLQKTAEQLRTQSQQGSMQVQGDAAETALKETLATAFPMDLVSDVQTGISGADLVQKVNAHTGRTIGIILWESKQTKAFQDSWLAKLKADQAAAKADIAILVTAVLPKDVDTFTERSGIWICRADLALPLASVLRSQLIAIKKTAASASNQENAMQVVYGYITGQEFRLRVEQLVLNYKQMKEDLERERRALKASLDRRSKQLDNLVLGTAGMYGDLQGIIGGSLPRVEQLELVDESELTPLSESRIGQDSLL